MFSKRWIDIKIHKVDLPWFTHWTWWFSIVLIVYQRVHGYIRKGTKWPESAWGVVFWLNRVQRCAAQPGWTLRNQHEMSMITDDHRFRQVQQILAGIPTPLKNGHLRSIEMPNWMDKNRPNVPNHQVIILRWSMVLEYLPTFTQFLWPSFVGKYTIHGASGIRTSARTRPVIASLRARVRHTAPDHWPSDHRKHLEATILPRCSGCGPLKDKI